MNYVYLHLSPSDFGFSAVNRWSFNFVPIYTLQSIYQTAKIDQSANIFLIANEKYICSLNRSLLQQLNVKIVDPSSIKHKLLDECLHQYIEHNKANKNIDPFWFFAFARYMYCEAIMQKYSLNDILFLEGDNLLYVPFDIIKTNIVKDYKGMITCGQTNHRWYSSGIFYCNSVVTLKLFNYLCSEKINGEIGGKSILNDMNAITFVSDLKVLHCKAFNCLPEDNNEYIFDPASYGQYLGGENHRHQNEKDSYICPCSYIAKNFLLPNKDKFSIYRSNSIYILDFNSKIYKLVNLHIHNKANFYKFILFKDDFVNVQINLNSKCKIL